MEYEIILLLSPSMSEDQAQAFVEEWKKDVLGPLGGKVSFEDHWGRKTLAYPIKKDTEAHYIVLFASIDGNKIHELDEALRLEKQVIRHLVSKEEKGNVRMTLDEIKAWNKEHLPEKPKPKRQQKKHAPRGGAGAGRRMARGPEDREIVSNTKPKAEEQTKLDKERLNKELDAILED